jgi:hypothetical protein
MHRLSRAAERRTIVPIVLTGIISGLALLIAGYGAWLSTRVSRRQEQREQAKRRSDIKVACGEQSGLDGPPVIGETVPRRHLLTIRVLNGGEAPEYVHSISLESESPSPFTVAVRRPEGTVEVRPRDQQTFELKLDGSHAFAWDQPFRAVVRLANEQTFCSEYGTLATPPHHGQSVVIPDPEQMPDDQVAQIHVPPGERIATVLPPDSSQSQGAD